MEAFPQQFLSEASLDLFFTPELLEASVHFLFNLTIDLVCGQTVGRSFMLAMSGKPLSHLL